MNRRYGSVLWVLVAFFGASIAFRGVRQLTSEAPVVVTLAAQLVVLAAIVALIVVLVRRRRDG